MKHNESYEFFPPAAVDNWVRTRLTNYYKWDYVASLITRGEPVAPEVVTAFANLAKAMKLPVSTDYQTMYIKREKPMEYQRREAEQQMRRAYEKGEIDASGNTVDQD